MTTTHKIRRVFFPPPAALAGTALASFMAVPALSQSYNLPPRATLEEAKDPACFAEILVVNRAGVFNRTDTIETDRGPVDVEYATNGGHNSTDHDEVSVRRLPAGVFATPMFHMLPDKGENRLRICLHELPAMM